MQRLQRNVWCGVTLATLLWVAQAASAQMTYVAIVDLRAVFDSHPQFTGQLQGLKQEAEALQSQVMRQKQELARGMESASLTFKPGTTEFSEQEKQYSVQMAQLEADARSRMRDLMMRESKLHFQVLREVNKAVSDYCVEKGIRIVLRFNRASQVDANNPESVMEWVNGTVVYHRPERDITDIVIQRMGGRVAAQPNGPTIRQ